MMQVCAKKGYSVVMWSIDSEDWRAKSQSYIKNKVFRTICPGNIVLFHDRLNTGMDKGMPHTVAVLPAILDSLTRAGFFFVTVSELQAMPPDIASFAPTSYFR
jgi:peptidoglycan/xylan/chitin deacetylase (PgdA/CDA1 family)